MIGDLHVHSTNSDGSVKIEELPLLAKAAGLTHLAITDHDTLKSVRFARAYDEKDGLVLIPGLELTSMDYERKRLVHVLCYDPMETPELIAFCIKMKRRRNAAAKKNIEVLQERFPAFRKEAAWKYSKDSGVLFKSSIIRVLYDYAYTDGIYKDLYRELFGREGICTARPHYDDFYDVLQLVRQAAGVAVFAHPSVYQSMDLCKECIKKGLIDGVEISHPRNTAGDRIELLNLAQEYGFIVTGGTDFHGINMEEPRPVGSCTTTEAQIGKLLQLAEKKKKYHKTTENLD